MTTSTSNPDFCPQAQATDGRHRKHDVASYIFGQWITTTICRDCRKVFSTITTLEASRG